jgi:DHA2 family multidrug resistance protein
LQELLGYTAWKAGLAMAPRGLGIMASMFLLGGIAKRGYDTRPLVALGFLVIGFGTWLLGGLNLNMSISNFVWPTILQGIGMGLVFPNLSASALSSIAREQMGYAASIYSMTRNIGGSIGTSVLTTILIRKQQVQQSHLSERVTVFAAWQLSHRPAYMPGSIKFDYMGQLISGQKQGLAMLYGAVLSQATMIWWRFCSRRCYRGRTAERQLAAIERQSADSGTGFPEDHPGMARLPFDSGCHPY